MDFSGGQIGVDFSGGQIGVDFSGGQIGVDFSGLKFLHHMHIYRAFQSLDHASAGRAAPWSRSRRCPVVEVEVEALP